MTCQSSDETSSPSFSSELSCAVTGPGRLRETAGQLARFAESYLGKIADDETAEAVSQVKMIVAGINGTSNN